jgi:hypothetical protein
VKNGSEKLVKVHVSSYLLPKGMTLESVQFNQKRLKQTPCVVQCNWGWLRRVVGPEVTIILKEQIMGLSVVDGIGLQQDVQMMASFHGVHSGVAPFVSPSASHILVSLPMNSFSDVKRTSGLTQRMIQHPVQSLNFAKNVKLLKRKEPPAPPLPVVVIKSAGLSGFQPTIRMHRRRTRLILSISRERIVYLVHPIFRLYHSVTNGLIFSLKRLF